LFDEIYFFRIIALYRNVSLRKNEIMNTRKTHCWLCFLTCFLLISSGGLFAQELIPISQARTQSIGTIVKVTGVVTNGSELGNIRYLQDGTAGIAAFGGTNGINRYDSITVTGELTEFNNLLEIGPSGNPPTYVNHGPASVIPTPQNVPISTVNEPLEGQLIVIDNVTFVQSGTFSGNTTYQVTDGSASLDLRINNSVNLVGQAIPTGAVSITGITGQFNANYQIIPRDQGDIVPYVPPQQKLNVLINGTVRLSGSTIFLGQTNSASITLQNLGVGALSIDDVTFSGSQASAYSTDISLSSIAPNSSVPYTITITPSGSGTQEATLTITSNDPNQPSYVLHFQASGTDGLASEPVANPTNLVFSENKAYKLSASFTASAGSPSYLVLWSNGSPVNGVPTDGVSYLRGDQIGNAKVAYVGGSTNFSPRGVIANQTYHFAIFAYNGQNGIENYRTSDPLVGSITSSGREVGTYYTGISTESPTFVSDLTALINEHTFITYYNYLLTMIPNFALRDTTGGQSYIECQYSGHKQVFSGNFAWQAQDFSREHVYAHSWMPGVPANDKPAYTDQHNLLPVRQTTVNSVRSNFPFGEVVTPNNTFLEAKRGINSENRVVYEPRDAIKGDVARALMYMAVSYNGTNGSWAIPNWISNLIPYGQDIDLLLKWHFEDLPDNYEIARNEYVYSLQGNRNPFIDSVHYACYINFGNMNRQDSPENCTSPTPPPPTPPVPTPPNNTNSLNETGLDYEVSVYPTPTKHTLYISSTNSPIIAYELIDLQGKQITSQTGLTNNSFSIDIKDFQSGILLIKLTTEKGIVLKKVIIE